jgi:hypothetical protein
MELNLKEVVSLWHELYGYSINQNGETKVITKGFLNQKMSLKVKLYVDRLAKVVNDEVEILNKTKKELYDKYVKEENQEVSEETIQAFNKDMEELMSAKKHIEVSSLWSSDLTINDLSVIETEEYYPIFYSMVDNTGK